MKAPSPAELNRIAVLPFLAALVFHGLAHQRLPLAVVVAIGLMVAFGRGWEFAASTRRLLLSGGAGLVVGAIHLLINQPPSGPIAPVPLSLLSGLVISLGVYFGLTRQWFPWGVSAWGLVVLSSSVRATPVLSTAMTAFIGMGLVCGAIQSGLLQVGLSRGGWRFLPASLAFVAAAVFAARSVESRIRSLEEPAFAWLQSMLADPQRPASSGATRDIALASRSTMELSLKPLLELSRQPDRLRAQVMDRFDGTRWTSSPEIRLGERQFGAIPRDPARERRLDVLILDETLDRVPAPAGTWRTRGFAPRIDGGWILFSREPVQEAVLFGDEREQLPVESPPGAELLLVPQELRAAFEPIAREILAGTMGGRAQAERLQRYFRDNFTYSLDTDLVGREPPLVVLMRERRPAYCVYFASAYALLLRSQGVPARVVGGYLTDERNFLTGRVTVRERDAHAWVEVWIADEERWTAFDPTPTASRRAATGVATSTGWVQTTWEAVGSLWRRLKMGFQRRPMQMILQFLGAPAGAALAALLLLKLWRRPWRRRDTAKTNSRLASDDPLLRQAYRLFTQSLRGAGITPGDGETDEELLSRLADSKGERTAVAAADFLERYRRARYRGEPADQTLLEAARRIV